MDREHGRHRSAESPSLSRSRSRSPRARSASSSRTVSSGEVERLEGHRSRSGNDHGGKLEQREKEKPNRRDKRARNMSPRTPSPPRDKRTSAIIVENLDQQSSGMMFCVKKVMVMVNW